MTPMRFRCCFHLAMTGELEMRSGGKKVKLTSCAWCAFVLQWRKGQDNALMHAGRLTQEYVKETCAFAGALARDRFPSLNVHTVAQNATTQSSRRKRKNARNLLNFVMIFRESRAEVSAGVLCDLFV